jgi:Protein of unknown function (DUF5818)
MPKTFMLALAILLSTAWLAAQSQYPQTGSGQTGTPGQTTIQGCLQESNGNYTLTSDSGMTYQLQGASSTLSKHVGHEVRITGSTASAGTSSSATSATADTSGKSQETLTVDSLKHISKTCNHKTK